MKTLRMLLLGLMLAAGLVSGAYANGTRVGVSINLGYPVYAAAPIYVAPPPPVYYAPPARIYYAPPPMFYVGAGYPGYSYRHNHGHYRGGHKHHRH
jgi:hypothetical protein